MNYSSKCKLETQSPTAEVPKEAEESWKDRLRDEEAELRERLQKLDAFLKTEKVRNLDTMSMSLLFIQHTVMKAYRQILVARMALYDIQ